MSIEEVLGEVQFLVYWRPDSWLASGAMMVSSELGT